MHQIRHEKRTTISEVIVRGRRNIKQNRNLFFFLNFLLKARVLFYCSFNTKFFFFKKEITLKNAKRLAHAIRVHYRDFEHAYQHTEFDCAALLAML